MAVLTDQERRDLWAKFMADMSRDEKPIGLTKADLRSSLDALDDWAAANEAAMPAAGAERDTWLVTKEAEISAAAPKADTALRNECLDRVLVKRDEKAAPAPAPL